MHLNRVEWQIKHVRIRFLKPLKHILWMRIYLGSKATINLKPIEPRMCDIQCTARNNAKIEPPKMSLQKNIVFYDDNHKLIDDRHKITNTEARKSRPRGRKEMYIDKFTAKSQQWTMAKNARIHRRWTA